jgi:hypothetical protein
VWRGRMSAALSLRDDLPVFLVLVGLPLSEVAFTVAGGYTNILGVEIAAALVLAAMVLGVYARGRRSGLREV